MAGVPGTHPYIEAAQILRARHAIDPQRIASINATGGSVQRMLAEPHERKCAPSTIIDAKFSIPFTIAVALLDDEVTLDSFDAASLADPAKHRLARRVTFEQHPDWARDKAASGILAVTMDDGRRHEHAIAIAAGDPDRPIDDAALGAKFRDCARRAKVPLAPPAIEELLQRLWSIDTAADARAELAEI